MSLYQYAPYEEIRVEAFVGDPLRTLPVKTRGGGFTVTVIDTGANPIPTEVVLEVNNSKYIDPTKQYHAVNPAYNFDTDESVRNAVYPPGLEPTIVDPEFNNFWIQLDPNLGADGIKTALYYETRMSWRWVRLRRTANGVIPPTVVAHFHMSA